MKRIILFLLIAILLVSCAPQVSPAEMTQISLPMGYIPNIQFAPFYVALEKGYFADNGIALELDYSFETDGIALVGAGDIPFSLASGEQVFLAREQDLPIKYIYTWYKDYPVNLITSDASVQKLSDLKGKQIGLPGLYGASYIGLRALIFSAGLSESDLDLNSIGYTQIESMLSGTEQNVVGYTNNEPILLTAQGMNIKEFKVANYYNMASNGIVTNEKTIKEDPDLIRAFLSALSKGIEDTVNNPNEAYEISKNYIDNLDQADESIQKDILAASIALWQKDPYGYSNQSNWSNMLVVLKDMGLVQSSINPADAYTNDFIK